MRAARDAACLRGRVSRSISSTRTASGEMSSVCLRAPATNTTNSPFLWLESTLKNCTEFTEFGRQNSLVKFSQFACQHRPTIAAEYDCHVGEGLPYPVAGFIKNKRRAFRKQVLGTAAAWHWMCVEEIPRSENGRLRVRTPKARQRQHRHQVQAKPESPCDDTP